MKNIMIGLASVGFMFASLTAQAELLVNAGWDDPNGEKYEWSTDAGNVGFKTVDGYKYAYGVSTPYFSFSQSVDLVSAGVDLDMVDYGALEFYALVSQTSYKGLDDGRMFLNFYDASGDFISQSSTPEFAPRFPDLVRVSLDGALPELTRTIVFSLRGYRDDGANNDAYFTLPSLTLREAGAGAGTSGSGGTEPGTDNGSGNETGVASDVSAPILLSAFGLFLMGLSGSRRQLK